MAPTAKIVRKTYIKVGASFKGPKKVAVGFPAGKVDGDILARAVWNEFGTKGSGKGFKTARGGGFGGPIPERPFLRNAMRDNRDKYRQSLTKAAQKLLREETSMSTVMQKLGNLAQGDIQGEITSLSSPPNSPVTVALKGSSNPLIDTGNMRDATSYEVRE